MAALELSTDEWAQVAGQLDGEGGSGWRGELPGVCRAARDGMDGGHLEVLQGATEQGCPWDSSTCSLAAAGGHLTVLQWARGQGFLWREDICCFAASEGHLGVLKRARA